MSDDTSAVYTHGHHSTVLRSHQWRTAENSCGYLLPHLRPGSAVLDIGCGPGTITADLALRVAPGGGRVTGTEISEAMAATARATAAERGAANTEFTVADVHALDFPDDSFDLVHAHQVLQHVADPVRALREMRRVCRPGGLVAVRDSDYAAFTWYPEVPELDDWLDLYRRIARSNRGEPDAGRRLLAWARAAGFPDDSLTPSASAWCYATPAERGEWGGMWAARIVESAIADQAVESGRATRQELARLSAGWRRWAAEEDGWFSALHGELLCRV